MNTQDIIAEAKKRLAELDAERAKLLRIIAASEGVEPVRLVPMPWPVWPAPTSTPPASEVSRILPTRITPTTEPWMEEQIRRFGSVTICATPDAIHVGEDAEAFKRAGLEFNVGGITLTATSGYMQAQGGVRWREPATRYAS
ncbi:MAG TPA: hypothetical protein VFB99_01520 [Vicinamibacterales bacterium]|nr:hypothetical protein [Vicinamibacterales bacterium]